MEKMEKKNLFNNISKYILQYISLYLPEAKFPDIIKYNKSLQKKIDISLFTYQNLFFRNKLLINYRELQKSKKKKNEMDLPQIKFNINELIQFLKNEFNSFTKKNEKQIVEKIIKEILETKELYQIDMMSYPKNKIKFIPFDNDINWKLYENTKNIVELNLNSKDIEKTSFFELCEKGYTFESKKFKIPSGIFPNLKSLKMGTNFIAPASLLQNLTQLYINFIPTDILIFLNDINKDEINLNKLKILKIIRDFSSEDIYTDGAYEDENLREYEFERSEDDKEEEKDEEKNDEEKNDEEYENEEDYEKEIEEEKKRIKRKRKNFFKKENMIKFNCPNLERLEICIRRDEDYNYLYNYFNFDFIYNAIKDIKPNINYIYNYLKDIFLNYKYNNNLKYFKFRLILFNGTGWLNTFKMKKFKNDLKRFTFKMFSYEENSCGACIKEVYEGTANGEKNLKKYFNLAQMKDVDDICIDKLNVLKIKNREEKYRLLDKNKINKLLNINKNNYSVQEICISVKDFDESSFENISKFRVLGKIVINNKFKNKKIFFKLIEDLSNLSLLKVIFIMFKGNLSSKDKKNITNFLPFITIEQKKFKKGKPFYEIKKYETKLSVDDEFELIMNN